MPMIGDVFVVKSKTEATALLNRVWSQSKAGQPAAVDTEFGRDEKTNKEYVTVWSVSTGKGDLNCLYADASLDVWRPWLEDALAPKVFQNYVADEDAFLESNDIVVRGLRADTMVMSAIVDTADPQHDLKYLEGRYLGRYRSGFKELFSYVPAGKKKPVLYTWPEIFASKELRRVLYDYSAKDAEGTIRLFNKFRKLMDLDGWNYYSTYLAVDVPFTRTLSRVMRRGFPLDVPYMQGLEREFMVRMMRLLHVFREMVDEPKINPNSFPQLQKLFFDKLDYPALRKTDSGAFAVDSRTLTEWEKAGLEPARLLNKYRELGTLKKTFVTGLLLGVEDDGKLYTDLNQVGAQATGRLSSRKYDKIIQVKKEKLNKKTGDVTVTYHQKKVRVGGNLQNIPTRSTDGARIRKAFVAEPGRKLVIADLAGAEWWMMGDRSKDPEILDQYRNKKDPHSVTGLFFFAKNLAKIGVTTWEQIKAGANPKNNDPHFKECKDARGKGKTGNFGFIYMCKGARAGELMELEDKVTKHGVLVTAGEQGDDYIRKFYSLYRGIRRYQIATIKQARIDGHVTMISGRRRHVPDIHADDESTREWAERAAVNATIQGSIADIIKAAMNFFELGITWPGIDPKVEREVKARWKEFCKLGAKMLLQVHDELLFSVEEDKAEETRQFVEQHMALPFAEKMDIKLSAEAKIASNWAEK